MINIMNICLALPTELGIHHVHDNNITYCNLEKVVIDIVRWCFSDVQCFKRFSRGKNILFVLIPTLFYILVQYLFLFCHILFIMFMMLIRYFHSKSMHNRNAYMKYKNILSDNIYMIYAYQTVFVFWKLSPLSKQFIFISFYTVFVM